MRIREASIALFVLTITAGCGAAASAPPPPSTGARPQPTAVPQTLATYASAAKPTLESSVAIVDHLVAKLRHAKPSSVGSDCSTNGPDLANLYSAFQAAVGPSSAMTAYEPASIGFKYSLSAIDECGMAADAGSKAQLKVAYHDLTYGLSKLKKASTSLSTWASAVKQP